MEHSTFQESARGAAARTSVGRITAVLAYVLDQKTIPACSGSTPPQNTLENTVKSLERIRIFHNPGGVDECSETPTRSSKVWSNEPIRFVFDTHGNWLNAVRRSTVLDNSEYQIWTTCNTLRVVVNVQRTIANKISKTPFCL